MISYVARALSLIASTLQNVISTASFTGEIILSAIIWVCTIVRNVLDNILCFFLIVYEDNVSVFTEIPNATKDVAYSAYRQLLFFQNGLQMVCLSIYHKLEGVLCSSKSLLNSFILIVSEVFKLVINVALLLGETTWLLITFIPVHLPQLIRSAIKYLLTLLFSLAVDAYMKLLSFTNYLTEVPLESFLGIICAIIVVRLCVHFKDTIVIKAVNLYWTLVRNIMYLYHMCHNYILNPEMPMFPHGDIMSEPYETVDSDDTNNGSDVLCVICQERQKCVLTLPCRHICLCTECCRRLYGYQRTCPICRTFIYHSVTVYL